MNSKKILLPAFILVALAQLYIPAKMIMDREGILNTGTEYKFKAAPIDPSDPFRGKYITLNYKENTVEIQNEKDWTTGETIYVFFTTDNEGYAKIKSVSKTIPPKGQDFLEAKVSYVTGNGTNKLTIDYPFDRYYMEESKAYDAELLYGQSLRDTNSTTFALINIKNGNSVLKDVLINGISIRELAKKESQK